MRRKRWAAVICIGVAVAAMMLCSATGSARQEEPEEQERSAEASKAKRVVQEQLEAYNRRDLDVFLATYSPEIRLYNFPDELRSSGLDAMREQYGAFFERTPNLHAEITKRIVQGNFVIDHEQVTAGEREFTAVAIYQVEGGKIVNVWFVR